MTGIPYCPSLGNDHAEVNRVSAGKPKLFEKLWENGQAYNIEYTIKRSEEDQRHLLSTVAIGYNGRLAMSMHHLSFRFHIKRKNVTMLKQFFLQVHSALHTDSSYLPRGIFEKEKPMLQKIVDSFQAPYIRNT